MSLKRWKMLACTLTIGVSGLAVYGAPFGKKVEAQNANDKPPVTTGSETKTAPLIPPSAKPDKTPPGKQFEIEIDIPLLPAPKPKPDDTAPPPKLVPPSIDLPTIIPVRSETTEPPMLLPVGGSEAADPKKEPKKNDTPKLVDVPKIDLPAPKKAEPLPPEIKLTPPAPPVAPLPPPDLKPSAPMVAPSPSVPPIAPVVPSTPPAIAVPEKKPEIVKPDTTKAEAAKLKMLLRMGDGKPRFEIRNTQTTELLMKVYGDRIEMQNPADGKSTLTGVTANGNVRFTAPGIEGTCDTLTILSATGEVMLKGNIRLKAKYGKTTSELSAEKMVYQIGTQGLVAPSGRTPATTASHIRD